MNEDQQQPPMNGNENLAKTLNDGLQFEETPMNGAPVEPAGTVPTPSDDDMKMPSLDPTAGDPDNEPMLAPTLGPTPPPVSTPSESEEDKPEVHHPHAKNHDKPDHDDKPKTSGNADLDNLKTSALNELRPLVRKLNLPAEERFDTLLLIIRSTDDQSLLQQAHDAAKEISDDTRRAQALLDVIKEIDYFSSKR